MRVTLARSFALSVLFLGCTGGEEPKESTPETPSFSLLDPGALIGGMTLDQLGADWARWMLEHPVTDHPVMDTTGAHCEGGQGDDVFYLAGTFGGDPVHRDCTTSHPGPFLLPVLNSWWDNCGTPPEELVSEEDLIAGIDESLDGLSEVELAIDGELIGAAPEDFAEYRTAVTAYQFTNPPSDSLYELWGYPFEGVCDSFAAGYYVPFELQPGTHEIELTAAAPYFSLEVSYTLTVQ